MVHPSFRGQGIFTRLLDFGLEHFTGLDLFFNFANPASAAGFAKRGWRFLAPLEDRVCQLGYDSIPSRASLLWIWSLIVRPTRSPYPSRRIAADELATRLSEDIRFSAPITSPGRAAVIRDKAYLRWRYLNHPFNTYDYYICEPTPDSFSLAICRSRACAGRIEVIDAIGFGVPPRLADWLEPWAAADPTATVVTWHTLPSQVRAGFFGNPLRRGQGRPFLVRDFPGRPLPFSPWDLANWYLTRGDLEIT